MAKYTSDTNLIRGAAAAYRDYSNAPGMYSGLDQTISAGLETVETAMQGRKAEQERIKKEEEEAKAKKSEQDNEWFNISGDVYANAGSFMKDVEYKNTAASISALKEKYIAAQESGDSEEMAAVMIEFNNIKKSVDEHKAFRETITHPEYGISNAMKYAVDANGDALPEGDNGEDHNFLIGLTKEEYTITTEGGKKYYNVGGVKKTMQEIQDMTILKDFKPFNRYSEFLDSYRDVKNIDKENVEYKVRNNILPSDIKGLRAFMADDGFGNGETFLQLLNKPLSKENKTAGLKSNRDLIEKELLSGVFNTDNNKSISETEWNNFTNAIVDPKNKFWENNGGIKGWEKNARTIATEQLTNGIINSNKNYFYKQEEILSDSPPADIDTSAYAEETKEEETPAEETKKESGPIANQLLTGGYGINKKKLVKALRTGLLSDDILKKYLVELPIDTRGNMLSINEDNEVPMQNFADVSPTAFNALMRKIQKEENINLGYK